MCVAGDNHAHRAGLGGSNRPIGDVAAMSHVGDIKLNQGQSRMAKAREVGILHSPEHTYPRHHT